MKVLIHGAGFANKGGEAMLLTVRRELARRLPDAAFLLPVSGEAAPRARSEGFEPILEHSTRLGKTACLAAGVITSTFLARVAMSSPRVVPRLRHMLSADLMVDASGFACGDHVPGSAAWHLHLVRAFEQKHGCCAYIPQAWGPFSNPAVARPMAEVCRLARVVYARDSQSLAHLQSLTGIPDGKILLAPDVAFRFQGSAPDAGRTLLTELGVPPGGGPIIGVVPNMRVYEHTPGEGRDSVYVRLLASLVEHCVTELGARVVLMPHEISLERARNDRYLIELVQGLCDTSAPVYSMTADYSAADLKAVIGHTALLVSSRYHATIAALSLRIPAVVVGWAHKYDELMRDAGLEEYVLQCQTADQDSLLRLVSQAWQRRRSLLDVLERTVPPMEKSADAVFDHTAEALIECYR